MAYVSLAHGVRGEENKKVAKPKGKRRNRERSKTRNKKIWELVTL